MTLPERLLWRELRGNPDGMKFRRQHPLGPYVLDFYCAAAKLGIEIDGIAHDMGNRPAADRSRDAFIASHGVEVLHLPASDVLASPQDVAASLVALCRSRRV